MEHSCPEVGCGHPKGRGRPRKGWVRVEGEFPDGRHGPRWFCSWSCVATIAAQMTQGEQTYSVQPLI